MSRTNTSERTAPLSPDPTLSRRPWAQGVLDRDPPGGGEAAKLSNRLTGRHFADLEGRVEVTDAVWSPATFLGGSMCAHIRRLEESAQGNGALSQFIQAPVLLARPGGSAFRRPASRRGQARRMRAGSIRSIASPCFIPCRARTRSGSFDASFQGHRGSSNNQTFKRRKI